MNDIYIGKSNINYMKRIKFEASDASTWGQGDISGRQGTHFENYHTKLFKVVAVVTMDSIPRLQKRDGTFKNAEEYALLLEKRLIESFMQMKMLKLLNKSTESGNKVDHPEEKAGFVVYVVARTDSKFNVINYIRAIV